VTDRPEGLRKALIKKEKCKGGGMNLSAGCFRKKGSWIRHFKKDDLENRRGLSKKKYRERGKRDEQTKKGNGIN